MAAAKAGHLEMIRVLVEKYDADTRIVAPDGQTALQLSRTQRDIYD
jgi:hypothetical protein